MTETEPKPQRNAYPQFTPEDFAEQAEDLHETASEESSLLEVFELWIWTAYECGRENEAEDMITDEILPLMRLVIGRQIRERLPQLNAEAEAQRSGSALLGDILAARGELAAEEKGLDEPGRGGGEDDPESPANES